ncbi:CBS domain-containing protein [Methylobacterium sp. J-088]|uniref:CBS domain-containing protein n=1 Tax=unclassified Methylobacterium TaxID=2615210 RepID=UPI001FBB64F7|nr:MULTISPECIES: CBS domain-containing protein [unclassified Methylobacterium]MCJ2063661.1 CBS domain-containing protein [Methylobacterium sp. J-088]
MTVARILADKGSSVVTVAPDKTLEEVIQILADRRIGALVVAQDDGSVAGIISERDIMRALAGHGGSAFDAPVSAHMTGNVTTCGRSTTIEEVMTLMTEGRFRHVPVCEDGRLIGLVSIGDVVARKIATVEAEHQALRDYITMA